MHSFWLMIAVTSLTSYLYCPRKLFLEKVLGIAEAPKDVMILGGVKHRVFDAFNGEEASIVCSIKKEASREEIRDSYTSCFSNILRRAIMNSRNQFKMAGLSPMDAFNEFLPFFSREAESRAVFVYDFMKKHKIYGEGLWNKLSPKIKSEYKISSESLDLSGKIDRIEIYDGSLVPVELKTGSPPKEGAWESHKIQLAAYALLLEDLFNTSIPEGVVHYIDSNKRVQVFINPFLKDQVKELASSVRTLLASKDPPAIAENRNKCSSCSLMEKCHGLVTEQKQNI
jgi:CRISPR-associated exonuclease Cas4